MEIAGGDWPRVSRVARDLRRGRDGAGGTREARRRLHGVRRGSESRRVRQSTGEGALRGGGRADGARDGGGFGEDGVADGLESAGGAQAGATRVERGPANRRARGGLGRGAGGIPALR